MMKYSYFMIHVVFAVFSREGRGDLKVWFVLHSPSFFLRLDYRLSVAPVGT